MATIGLIGSSRFERLFAAWTTALTECGHTVVDLRSSTLARVDTVVVLNLHAYVGWDSLQQIERAEAWGLSRYALSSWGVGFGVGPLHSNAARRAAADDGVLGARSPISTTSPHFRFAYDLLGPAGAHRSRLVKLLNAAKTRPRLTGKTWRCWVCQRPAQGIVESPEINSDQTVPPLVRLGVCADHFREEG